MEKEAIVPTREEVDQTRKDPRALFKFCAINKNSLSSLLRRRFWFAKPESFNDPFDTDVIRPSLFDLKRLLRLLRESKGCRLSARSVLQGFLHEHDSIARDLRESGIFSMSASPYVPLLWSHYADDHRGMCIQFERTHENELKAAYEVSYSLDMAKLLQLLLRGASVGDAAVEVARTKDACWSYEREWRHWLFGNFEQPEDRLCPIDARIQAIVFGCRTSEADIEAVRAATQSHERLAYFRMGRVYGRFELALHPLT